MVQLDKKIISKMATRKDNEGEIALCRTMFVVTLRDMLSSSNNYYTKKCRQDAKTWLKFSDETYFSFSNVVDYLFSDVDSDELRKKLVSMLNNRKIKGTRNLVKILSEINEEVEQDEE